ncbi:peptidase M14 [marine bacterium AO1-C]|nr:peptidase M14 [marine bacterium AO1-C]
MDNDIEVIKRLELDTIPDECFKKYWVHLVSNGIAQPIYIPVMVARGKKPGPVLGITAAVHGNELNGISVIQKVFKQIDVKTLTGTLVGVIAFNVPSLLNQERRFIDGEDINRIMPGREKGNTSEVYVHRMIERVIAQFDYLIDLHTASFGRINSYYIRANMNAKVASWMAKLQNADIVLNNQGADGTLRSAAADLGIHSITSELGDPNRFQKGMIRSGLEGIFNVMIQLKMIQGEIQKPDVPPVYCDRSFWIYANEGGILEVLPNIQDEIQKGQKIAVIKNVFGDIAKEYFAPTDGIVIGKSVHPINQTGGRILHLGVFE